MNKKLHIRFIINPKSGVGSKARLPDMIEKLLDQSKYTYEISYTTGPGHATELARDAADKKMSIVVACGGDGSVNEVSAGLIGSETRLAIIPRGSGNGLAMYLGLGRGVKKALRAINHGRTEQIDICYMNDRPYINMGGVGYAALVAYKLKSSKLRGFIAYAKFAVEQASWFKGREVTVTANGETKKFNTFLIEVANGAMFGYNVTIAPKAKLNDGLLDVFLVKYRPRWRIILSLALRWPFNVLHKSSLVNYFKTDHLKIEMHQATPYHMDGEGGITRHTVEYRVAPKAINIIVPKQCRVL